MTTLNVLDEFVYTQAILNVFKFAYQDVDSRSGPNPNDGFSRGHEVAIVTDANVKSTRAGEVVLSERKFDISFSLLADLDLDLYFCSKAEGEAM